ncbi:nucleotidyltransferase domain-containing protein [Thermococcus indicus]|uniref:nucleotidyltransferase domain-containing protein n=1 Tax=Thermococcus indicus TaxID=2586643 RepID=UPI001F0F9D31|nr:nucleotidyltransferase domain-containing protein [Thermococcus indicus]
MEVRKLIHDTVINVCGEQGVGVVEIILFGSRAKGTAKEGSDWDILLVTDGRVEWKKRLHLTGEIRKRLAKKGLAMDILVVSKEELERLRDSKEYIYYYALREGIPV